jgi:hypothetical protein
LAFPYVLVFIPNTCRKVSKFITGTNEDNVLPIQVFYDPETGEILKDGLPDEFKFILEDDQN